MRASDITHTNDSTAPAWLNARWVAPTDQIDALTTTAPEAVAHVWFAAPDPAHAAAVAPWLSSDERARRDSFRHDGALAQFLTGRWLLRGALASHLGAHPAGLQVALSERGALSLPEHPGWCCNLSHTHALVAVTLARTPVGIDVEAAARDARIAALAERYFAPAEVAGLRALPEPAQRERFFRLWTLKEAYIKARGQGMAIPLKDFAFDLDAPTPTFTTTPALATPTPWRFASWRPTPSHLAAVALQSAST